MVSYSFQGNKRFWTARDEEENEKIFSEQSKPTGIKIPNEVKPVYLANAEYEVEKWSVTQIMRLLRLYAAHRCLWDVACKDNHNRKMRQAALIDITAAMGGGVTKEHIVQKINVIRATYRYEKKRIKQRIRRGMGARTKLKWFALADAFLRKIPKKGQKNEDPYNSDSDLEDTIVFSINPESLVPLESEFTVQNPKDFPQNLKNCIKPKQELFSDDSQSPPALWENEVPQNLDSSNDSLEDNKPLNQLKLELQECDLQEENDDKETAEKSFQNLKERKDIKVDSSTSTKDAKHLKQTKQKSSNWSFEDTLQFIKLLKSHAILWDLSLNPCDSLEFLALKAIANDMVKPIKSIEKRWHIFKQTYAEEKQKILENPLYKPKYKWWSQAQNLMESESNMKTRNENQLESIFLQENENPESSDIDNVEDYEKFLQNPIPSVAPLSNMNEAMASLFNQPENDEDLPLESNTNSSFPKENDSTALTTFTWHFIEDDLLEGKWSLKHSVKFLRLYGVHRCLWDLNDADYRSRPLRNAAYEDIAASMGHGLTASYVAKKIKIFRITYMQQRKRILEATEKGETPEILLKWFPLADSFLRPHIGLRSIKSDAKEMPQFDCQYVYANLNLIDPALLTDFRGKGTQNAIEIGGNDSDIMDLEDS